MAKIFFSISILSFLLLVACTEDSEGENVTIIDPPTARDLQSTTQLELDSINIEATVQSRLDSIKSSELQPSPTPLTEESKTQAEPAKPPEKPLIEKIQESLLMIVPYDTGNPGLGTFITNNGIYITTYDVTQEDYEAAADNLDGYHCYSYFIKFLEEENIALGYCENRRSAPISLSLDETEKTSSLVMLALGTANLAEVSIIEKSSNIFGDNITFEIEIDLPSAELDHLNPGLPIYNLEGKIAGLYATKNQKNYLIPIEYFENAKNELLDESSESREFESELFWFSLTLPDGWVGIDLGYELFLFDFNSSATIQVYFDDEVDPEMTTEEFAEYEWMNGRDSGFMFYETDEATPILISQNIPAIGYFEKWAYYMQDMRNNGWQYFFIHDGISFSIYTETLQEDWESQAPTIQRIIDSIVIE